MKITSKKIIIICFSWTVSFAAQAQIKLPAVIRDSMILQRNEKINIWGWASKGEKVSRKV